jgi:hypothetical protein
VPVGRPHFDSKRARTHHEAASTWRKTLFAGATALTLAAGLATAPSMAEARGFGGDHFRGGHFGGGYGRGFGGVGLGLGLGALAVAGTATRGYGYDTDYGACGPRGYGYGVS